MGLLDTIGNFFGDFWNLATDFLTLIFVIIWAIMFFVIQYYIIKLYFRIGKTIYDILDYYNIINKTPNPIPSPAPEDDSD